MTEDSRPASQQVADALRDEITSGRLAPGDKLPSIRQLAERYGIAAMTAQNAIDVLRDEGLIYSSPGRGTFVRTQSEQSSSTAEPSPEYLAITEHLSDLSTQVHDLAGRVSELEKLARQEDQEQP